VLTTAGCADNVLILSATSYVSPSIFGYTSPRRGWGEKVHCVS